MLEMALVENIQREELDSIEIGLAYQRLIEELKLNSFSHYFRAIPSPKGFQANALISTQKPNSRLDN
jgi:hypothetical protein